MLNAMRQGSQSKLMKFILFSFLGAAVGGMALMDVGGFFGSGVGNNAIAKIGRQSISSVEFDQTVRRALAQQGMQIREAYEFGMVDQILQSEINQRLLTQAAYDTGIYAGDETVARLIGTLIDPLVQSQPNAKRSDILQTILRAQGMTEKELVATMRQNLMITTLQSTIQVAASVPSRGEALNLYQVQNETRDVQGFFLSDDSVKGVEEAQEEVLKAFYEAGKSSRYVIPETRSFTIAILGEKNLSSTDIVTDEELERAYQKSIKSYTLPERRELVQAVLSNQVTAQKVADTVRNENTSLKDAVKSVTGSITTYQDETVFAREGLVTAMADAAFSTETGMISDPVQTPLGWHVFIVTEILPEAARPFAAVKDTMRQDLVENRLSELLFETANLIDDRLAGGDEIEDIATEMNLTVTQIGPVTKEGSTIDKRDALKDFEADRDHILQTAFDLAEGEAAPVFELSNGRYAALHVNAVTESGYQPYEEVKADLTKSWISDQKASLNRARAQAVQQDIAAGNKTLSKAAGEFDVKIEKFTGLKRTGEAPKSIGQDGQAILFSTVEGEAVMVPVPRGYFIAMIDAVSLPDRDKVTDKDLETLVGSIADSTPNEMTQAYLQHLQSKSKVKINRHLLNTLYGPESGI